MKKIYIYALAGVLALSSCDEFLREEPEDFMSAESEDVDEALIEAEIQGAYKSTLWFKNGRQGFIGITGTDEARGKTNQNCSKTRIKYGYSSFRFGYRVGRINNRKVAL